MKLRRIEARAFGALRDCAIEDLGDGLTVVLGPNESGKSTYTALVRQVLYGFPDKRSREYGYEPRSGGRAGRLVFEDPAGRWALSRTEGARGGVVSVDTLSGQDRPALAAEVVGSITEQTYRVVFGFGLDELASIASGADENVVQRLFAGAFGLNVNPMDVRQELGDSAGRLFKPRGKAVVNDALGAMRDVKTRIRELEGEARDFAADQARLKEMAERLEPLRAARAELDLRVRALERDAERARGLEASIAESAEQAVRLEDQRAAAQNEERHTVVDERLLAIAPDIAALLQEQSGARQHADQAKQHDARVSEARRRAAAYGIPDAVSDTAEARSALEAWRTRKARLESDVESADRTASAAIARARSYHETAGAAPRSRRSPLPLAVAIAAVLVGVATGVAGVLSGQWIAVAGGAVAALLGVVLLVVGRGTAADPAADITAEAVRFEAEARSAEELAAGARERLAVESAQWAAWLAERQLDARGTDPAAVAEVLDAARERAKLLDQADALEVEGAHHREAAAEWGRRLVELAKAPLGVSQTDPDPYALAIRAGEAVTAAQTARDKKAAAHAAAEAASAELEAVMHKAQRLQSEFVELMAAHGAAEAAAGALEDAAARVGEELARASEACEQLAREHDELAGRLGTQGREDLLARERQRLEGLEADARAAGARYVVETMAARLVDLARERFERDRQPEVVQTAARVFQAMTGGRFVSVRVPLGGESITVVTAGGDVLAPSQLSRGTAEQLYLALRVGLIESFGMQGPHLPVLMDDIVVNYDAERIRGAGAAVAELAAGRQVIFFTCHEGTAEVLMNAVPGATGITLDHCTL